MKLSMWIICKELSEFHPLPVITDGKMDIEDVRVFSYEREPVRPDYLYVGKASDFYGKKNANQILLVNKHDFIFVEGVELEHVLNALIKTFSYYRNLEYRVFSASKVENPFQEILDIAHEEFRCPMFFGRHDMHIFAITEQYKDEDVFPFWEDIVSTKTYPKRLLESLYLKNFAVVYPEFGTDQTVMPSDTDHYSCTIRNCCYLNNKIWGHLYLFYKDGIPDEGTLQLIWYFAMQLTECVRLHKAAMQKFANRYPALISLLDGEQIEPKQLQALLDINSWEHDTTLLLCKIKNEMPEFNRLILPWLNVALESAIVDCLVLSYQDAAVVVAAVEDNRLQEIERKILSVCQKQGFLCGLSFLFNDLGQAASHYRQASYALEYAASKGMEKARFSECALEGLIFEMKRTFSTGEWICPDLMYLRQVDRKQGSDYYNTLHQYLLENCHIANTAKSLFIHRNTLIYRLDRINEYISIDIRENRNRTYLLMCFELLERTDG